MSQTGTITMGNSWTPNSEADCKLWISADFGCTKPGGGACADGDQLGTWTDQSTSALTVQGGGAGSSSALNPLYKTNISPSGLPGILFDGSNDFAKITSLVTTMNFCMFFVAQFKNSVGLIVEQSTNINSNNGIAFYGGTGYSFNTKRNGTISQSDYNGNLGGQNASVKITWNYDSSLSSTGTSQTSFNGSTRFNYREVAATSQFASNGTVNSVDRQTASGVPTAQTVTDDCYLMSRGGASLFTNAYIYEMATFNSSKDQNFFKQVENYVYTKWGI